MNEWISRAPHHDAVKFTNDKIRGEIRHRSNWIILFPSTDTHTHIMCLSTSSSQMHACKRFLFTENCLVLSRLAFVSFSVFCTFPSRILGDNAFWRSNGYFYGFKHLRSIVYQYNVARLLHWAIFRFAVRHWRRRRQRQWHSYILFHNSEYLNAFHSLCFSSFSLETSFSNR